MKKILILAIAFIGALSSSCSSDDDNALEGVDPILGKWFLSVQYIVTEKDGKTLDTVDFNVCQETDFIEVKSDKTITIKKGTKNTEDKCVVNTKSGTWSREFTSKYKYKLQGDDNDSFLYPIFSTTTIKISEKETVTKTSLTTEEVVNGVKIKRVYFLE